MNQGLKDWLQYDLYLSGDDLCIVQWMRRVENGIVFVDLVEWLVPSLVPFWIHFWY